VSTAATQARVRGVTNTRRVPRFPLAVRADVTVLRSGIPYSIPGRSFSIGERGLGVVLAGELHPGDSVGLEFRLPDTDGRLRLQAVVRYQALLHCGLEFQNLTAEQQTLIEHWTRKRSAANTKAVSPAAGVQSPAPPAIAPAVPLVETPERKSRRPTFQRALWIMLAGAVLLGGLVWWHWYRAWDELESQIPESKPLVQPPPATVAPEVMEGLIIHKVEPIYPEAARRANIQGVVVLDAVIGADGIVIDVRPISGPEELTPAAVDAVKWWRFRPYLLNGEPAKVTTRLAVDFRGN
jgi:TonB family protein